MRPPSAPRHLLVLRAYGNILYTVGQWGGRGDALVDLEPAHLDRWMADCRTHGVDTVLWRANCAGTLTYPSRHTALAGEPPLPAVNRGLGVAVVEQGWTRRDWEVLGAQCRRFHTLETAAQAAHRHGLAFYLEWERWAAEGLVDALIFWAPWDDGAEVLAEVRQRAGVPVYLFRKFAGWGGQVRSPHTLQGYRREVEAVRQGRLDGYCLHVSVAVPHPQAQPSWRDVYA
ncbi:MAG: hypothetical protein AB1505_04080 [Candidatus Latescibacterota bacterium]